jgi:hypothetical protein
VSTLLSVFTNSYTFVNILSRTASAISLNYFQAFVSHLVLLSDKISIAQLGLVILPTKALFLNHVEGQEVANPIYDCIGLGLIDLTGYLHPDHTEGNLLGRNLTAEDYSPYL